MSILCVLLGHRSKRKEVTRMVPGLVQEILPAPPGSILHPNGMLYGYPGDTFYQWLPSHWYQTEPTPMKGWMEFCGRCGNKTGDQYDDMRHQLPVWRK